MSDISLRFEIQTSQRQVMLKLEFECRTEEGAGGNSGFDRKWILTNLELPQSCAALSCQISRQSANVRLSYWRFSTLPRCNLRGGGLFFQTRAAQIRDMSKMTPSLALFDLPVKSIWEEWAIALPMIDSLEYIWPTSTARLLSVVYWYTRKRGNCECIATWGCPSHASPFTL